MALFKNSFIQKLMIFLLIVVLSISALAISLKESERSAYMGDSTSQYNLAMTYIEEQDYDKAFYWFKKASNQGEAESQKMLCGMYYEGIGVRQDHNKALDWCKKSADQGNIDAQTFVGMIYYEGKAVRQDYSKAFNWFEKAAKQGEPQSQLKLCAMYMEGQGVRQDHNKAFNWCKKSANQGNIYAEFNLGLMYLHGEGVHRDFSIAEELFGQACDNGIQEGCDGYKRLKSVELSERIFISDQVFIPD